MNNNKYYLYKQALGGVAAGKSLMRLVKYKGNLDELKTAKVINRIFAEMGINHPGMDPIEGISIVGTVTQRKDINPTVKKVLNKIMYNAGTADATSLHARVDAGGTARNRDIGNKLNSLLSSKAYVPKGQRKIFNNVINQAAEDYANLPNPPSFRSVAPIVGALGALGIAGGVGSYAYNNNKNKNKNKQ